jgi:hypothetical protein
MQFGKRQFKSFWRIRQNEIDLGGWKGLKTAATQEHQTNDQPPKITSLWPKNFVVA